MARDCEYFPTSHDDEVSRLKARIAELERMDTEHTLQIAKMNGYISHLEEERRWRKCSEELPEDGAEVLATDGDGIWLCYKTTMSDGSPWFQPDGLPHIEGITHWMPLPSARRRKHD